MPWHCEGIGTCLKYPCRGKNVETWVWGIYIKTLFPAIDEKGKVDAGILIISLKPLKFWGNHLFFENIWLDLFNEFLWFWWKKNHHTICLIFELLGKISWSYSFWGHEFEFFLTGVISQILIKSLNRCYFMPQALKISLIFQHVSPNSRPDKLKEFFLNSS